MLFGDSNRLQLYYNLSLITIHQSVCQVNEESFSILGRAQHTTLNALFPAHQSSTLP